MMRLKKHEIKKLEKKKTNSGELSKLELMS